MTLLNFLIGIATGIVSGFGIGGGSLLVLYLTAVNNIPQRTAGGINLLYFIGCAPFALIGHAKNKRIEWRTALWCGLAAVAIAVPVGILFREINANLLRRLFGVLLLYIGIKELRSNKEKSNK